MLLHTSSAAIPLAPTLGAAPLGVGLLITEVSKSWRTLWKRWLICGCVAVTNDNADKMSRKERPAPTPYPPPQAGEGKGWGAGRCRCDRGLTALVLVVTGRRTAAANNRPRCPTGRTSDGAPNSRPDTRPDRAVRRPDRRRSPASPHRPDMPSSQSRHR